MFIVRFAWAAVAVAVVALAMPVFAADGIEEVLRETHWGESSDELARQFGTHAIRLPRALDFGDSYADVVLRFDESRSIRADVGDRPSGVQ